MTGETDALTGFTPQHAAAQRALEARFLPLPSAGAFRQHIETLTKEPHVAGTAANARVGRRIGEAMRQAGLHVECFPYDVLLDEPAEESLCALVTPVRLPLNHQEYILPEDPHSAHAALGPGWVAYAGSGDVTGEVVYANYGRREDYRQLAELGVDLTDKIVLARYGGNFRGYKLKYAEEAGAAGVILFTDPRDAGYEQGLPYPEGAQMPPSGVQRGSTLVLPYNGDPLTPGRPALPLDGPEQVERLDPDILDMPRIPALPLPYGSTVEILQRMAGAAAPHAWQGGLPCTYRLTGGPGLTVRLRVAQQRALRRITNVVGTIPGAELPDEWVLLGCHYDAWGFGTADPNSGTAMLICLCDALGQLLAEGWRPRRTIKVAHWDGEEFAIIGSSEWVEQFAGELQTKLVAYLNADMAATGGTLFAAASPALKRAIIEATQAVQRPDADETLHARWLAETDTEVPPFGALGGGSDHVGFYAHLGVPSAGVNLSNPCPVYHSAYDDLAWYERFADGSYTFGPTLARLDGVLALRLAQADLLPYDVGAYAPDLRAHLSELAQRAQTLNVAAPLDGLTTLADELAVAAEHLVAAQAQALAKGALTAKAALAVNQGLSGLEKALLRPEGLQTSGWTRSLWAGEDPFSGYAAWMLPGLRYEIETQSAAGLAQWVGVYEAALRELAARMEHLTALLTD